MADESLDDFKKRTGAVGGDGAAASGGESLEDFRKRTGAVAARTSAPPSTDDMFPSGTPQGADVPQWMMQAPPSLEDIRGKIQQGETGVLNALKPGPDAGVPEQVLRTAAAVGVHGLSGLAQLPVNALIGLREGPSGGVTWNPDTGTYGLTPEAASVVPFATGIGGRDIRFSGPRPLEFVPPTGAFDRGGPLPTDTAANLLSPDARARATEPPTGPTTATGVPVTPPASPSAPPLPSPAMGAPSGAVPMTSDAARGVAKAYYDTFDRAAQDGGSLTPQATNKFIASVEAAAPKPGIGQAVAGKNTISDLVERLQDYKNQPMSLQDAHVVDQQLGNLISGEYGKTGVSNIGRQLQDIQQNFRDQLSNPEAGDVVSGQSGLDALAPARKAYSQAMKLDTIERIQQRADMTDNPSTSFRTQIRTLLNNDRMSRGFSDEEKDALRAAANRGAAATALHLLGSRLIPIISGSTGTGAGLFGAGPVGAFLGASAGTSAGYFLNEAARAGENALAARRLRNAYTVLGKSVPPNPLQP